MARCVNASHLEIPDLSPRDFGNDALYVVGFGF